MPVVAGIRFKNCGKIYDFDLNGFTVNPGDRVIVESEFGLSIGNVVAGPRDVDISEKELKKVVRVATEEDLRQKRENEDFEKDARAFCLERIMARGLPMKLVCSEVTLDRKRIVFYFTADGRIDFRELVKDLAAKFKTRIEMRQIGVRDKAKMVGGLGLCGKELCCRLFLTSFEPISIKMAKQQELVLNTGKLSGICGRLMCCLGYEYNDGTTPTGPVSEKQPSSEEQREHRVATREDETIKTETISPPGETPPAVSGGPAGEQAESKGREKPKRHKRRRRHPKRSQKNE